MKAIRSSFVRAVLRTGYIGLAASMLGGQDIEGKRSSPFIRTAQNSANTGDRMSGVIVKESRSELLLDTTPCEATEHKQIVAFPKPYKKKNCQNQRDAGTRITNCS